jgi:NitT/TauT family transport system permease protein
MAVVVFHTQRVREALQRSSSLGADLLVLLMIAGLFGVGLLVAEQASAPLHARIEISLSFWALPGYTLMSLARGFLAYALSLAFTLTYGTIAAHNARAEKFMLPVLDVLQAIPVLGFLPGLVLALVNLFPTRQIGLELACVIMIFTGQVWNMTFSFHSSLRGIPTALREVARLNELSGWQVFRLLEVPAAMIGLVWNSMMSMAGGWFFLTVNEAFTLGERDFRLPGIGAYMNEAIHQGDVAAMIAAIIAMAGMIIVVDQLFWRPIVVWSQRFKVEEQEDPDPPESWMLALLKNSRLVEWVSRHILARLAPKPIRHRRPADRAGPSRGAYVAASSVAGRGRFVRLARSAALLALAAGLAFGGWQLARLLMALPLQDPASHRDWGGVLLALLATFARTSSAVLIGALWALPVGVAIGLSPRWSKRLQPVIQVVASFPAPMLFPLVTLALMALRVPFSIGCIALMLLGAQWYILFNVIAGAMAIPSELREVTRVYRLNAWMRWRKLYLPCVFPYLLTGLITAAGGAWNASIVSEYVQFRGHGYRAFGLGSLISEATEQANYPLLAAAVVTMSAFVVLLNRFFWKRLYRVAETRCSLNV